MTRTPDHGGAGRGGRWRMAVWGAAAVMLALPLVGMLTTDEVNWGAADFALFGAMLVVACGAYELAARGPGGGAYRAAVGVALAAAFLLVWTNGAVGLIGSEDNPANLMYGGVLAVGIVGAAAARLRPRGMARALAATALAQALVAVLALGAGLGVAGPVSPADVVMLTGFFAALWLASAWLFRRAARGPAPAGAAP